MCNKNGKIYMMKNIWQRCKQIWKHCFFVASYDVVSYYRFLNTDPGFFFSIDLTQIYNAHVTLEAVCT
jgi:hypothetical protein